MVETVNLTMNAKEVDGYVQAAACLTETPESRGFEVFPYLLELKCTQRREDRHHPGGSFPASGAEPLICPFSFPAGITPAQMVACEVADETLTRPSPAVTLRTTSTNENNALSSTGASPQ